VEEEKPAEVKGKKRKKKKKEEKKKPFAVFADLSDAGHAGGARRCMANLHGTVVTELFPDESLTGAFLFDVLFFFSFLFFPSSHPPPFLLAFATAIRLCSLCIFE
jgi:hypothetical protein